MSETTNPAIARAHQIAEAKQFGEEINLEIGQYQLGSLVLIDTRWMEKSDFQFQVGTAHFQDPASGDYFGVSVFNGVIDQLERYNAVPGHWYIIKRMPDRKDKNGNVVTDKKGNPVPNMKLFRIDPKTGNEIAPPPLERPKTRREQEQDIDRAAEKARKASNGEAPPEVINLDDLDDDQFFGPPDGGPEKTVTVDVILPAERVAVGATADPDEG